MKGDWMLNAGFALLIIAGLVLVVANIVTVIECPKHGGEVHGSFPAECYGAHQ
jgi:hypothetical protein